MKRFAATVVALALLSLVCAHANQASGTASSDAPAATSSTQSQTITITRSGSQPSSTGAAAYFTGSGRIEPLFQAKDSARAVGARVTFVPGAPTAWHPPLGQTLIVTAGTGWIQQWGGSIEEIREGDVVWIPLATKHWHGATPTAAMTHITIQELLNSKNVKWMEKASDEKYHK